MFYLVLKCENCFTYIRFVRVPSRNFGGCRSHGFATFHAVILSKGGSCRKAYPPFPNSVYKPFLSSL